MTTNIYRYPGITPFTMAQKEVFFGRENDIELLFNLVCANKQTLIYSKSGLGKSSLINAGLMPKLTQNGAWQFSPLRFYAYTAGNSISLNTNIISSVGAANLPETFLDKIIANENSLWYAFKKAALLDKDANADRKTHLLIFDQFEEIFSYPEEDIFLFKKQLTDLLYSEIPLNFRKVLEVKLRKQPDLLTKHELELLSQPLNIKVLFAIRDDRLSLVKQLSDYLPDILRIMYELKPLTREQAIRAIDLPAKSSGKFASESFEFTTEAVHKIISFLTKENTQAVESTQLQILCNRCEMIATAEAKQNRGEAVKISAEKIPNFDNVFIDFYFNVLAQLPQDQHDKAQAFIENNLIVKEQRISLDQLICLDYVSEQSLLLLANLHLLRTEQNSTRGISYELSHDTLVSPIMQVRKARLAKIEEENQLRIKNEELRVAKEKAAKERRKLVLVIATLIFALSLSGIAMWKWVDAEQKTTEISGLLAKFVPDSITNVYLYAQKQADYFMTFDAKPSEKIDCYAEAIKFLSLAKYAKDKPVNADMAKLDKQISNLNTIINNRLIAKAHQLYYTGKYIEAQNLYQQILQLNPKSRTALLMKTFCLPPREHFMVKVEPGKYKMDENYIINHTKSFYIAAYEVTNAQYARFLNDYGSGYIEGDYAGMSLIEMKGDNFVKCRIKYGKAKFIVEEGYELFPIMYVSWYAANEYCRFYGLSLPTEAQWKYAAAGGPIGVDRHGYSAKYEAAGSNNIDSVAWCNINSAQREHFVGELKPNQLGLYDMSGNLLEWCSDWYGEYDISVINNPRGAQSGQDRVVCGGSWNGYAQACRLGRGRSSSSPANYGRSIGFRLARDI